MTEGEQRLLNRSVGDLWGGGGCVREREREREREGERENYTHVPGGHEHMYYMY